MLQILKNLYKVKDNPNLTLIGVILFSVIASLLGFVSFNSTSLPVYSNEIAFICPENTQIVEISESEAVCVSQEITPCLEGYVYSDGSCTRTIQDTTGCPLGFQFNDTNCTETRPDLLTCPPGTVIQNNQCVVTLPNGVLCPDGSPFNGVPCTESAPNLITCPEGFSLVNSQCRQVTRNVAECRENFAGPNANGSCVRQICPNNRGGELRLIGGEYVCVATLQRPINRNVCPEGVNEDGRCFSDEPEFDSERWSQGDVRIDDSGISYFRGDCDRETESGNPDCSLVRRDNFPNNPDWIQYDDSTTDVYRRVEPNVSCELRINGNDVQGQIFRHTREGYLICGVVGGQFRREIDRADNQDYYLVQNNFTTNTWIYGGPASEFTRYNAENGEATSLPVCPSGTLLPGTSDCYIDTQPICPAGYSYNETLISCLRTVDPQCPSGLTRVPGTNDCTQSQQATCPTGYTLDLNANTCLGFAEVICPTGFTRVPNTFDCTSVLTSSCPPGWLVFDQNSCFTPAMITQFNPLNLGVINGRAFNDLNKNGVLDPDVEVGLPQITVELIFEDEVVMTTITDSLGQYQFNNVIAGTYSIRFVNSDSNRQFTTAYSIGNPEFVSTVDSNGRAEQVVVSNESIFVNAGIHQQPATPEIFIAPINENPPITSNLGTTTLPRTGGDSFISLSFILMSITGLFFVKESLSVNKE